MTLKMSDEERPLCKIAVITNGTRPGRKIEAVARWVCSVAEQRNDAEIELVDITHYNIPSPDEPAPASCGQCPHERAKNWSEKIASFDAYIFVIPEYHHRATDALKNAIDCLYDEWRDKVAGFVSYGGHTGRAHAIEHLRLIAAALLVATVPAQVVLSLFTDFENFRAFKPGPERDSELKAMLEQLIAWGTALRTMRCDAA